MIPDTLSSKKYRRYLAHTWRKSLTALNKCRLTSQTRRLMSKQNLLSFFALFLFLSAVWILRYSLFSGLCASAQILLISEMLDIFLLLLQRMRCAILSLSVPCKSRDLYPIPTALVNICINILVTPIASIVNLLKGSLPSIYSQPIMLVRFIPLTLQAWSRLLSLEKARTRQG